MSLIHSRADDPNLPRMQSVSASSLKQAQKHVVIMGAGPAGLTAAYFQKNKLISTILLFFVFLTVCLTYFYFAIVINKNIFQASQHNYYVYLINAFIHGHVDVTPPTKYDLSLFHNKWYLYWGPAPGLFILPFYIISRLHASDVIFTLLAGIGNVVIFYFVIQECKAYFKVPLTLISTVFLLLSFGLASPNFFLSLAGKIWFTNQVIAITYLLLFYLFYFKFLNSGRYLYLLLCVIFFNLAWLSRYSLLFNGILFLYLFLHYRLEGKNITMKTLLSIGSITLGFIILGMTYNFLKFHSLFETGLQYQVGSMRFDALIKSGKILSIHYILYNAYYYFFNFLQFSPAKPYVIINTEGNSVFAVYPALLLLVRLFFKTEYLDKKRVMFLSIAGVILGLSILSLLLYYATGWSQFGNRYFFDVVPLLFILTIFILKYIPIPLQVVLLLYGVFVNFAGVLAFYNIMN